MRAVFVKNGFVTANTSAIEPLENAGLRDKLETKIVYAPSISLAKQLADTGNVEAAFTALALTVGQTGNSVPVAFTAFLADPESRAILTRFGYMQP